MRIGIYGGSFNPVHNGHIHLAETAMREFNLDHIFFVPSRISPHKSSDEYVSGEDRLEMLKIATSVNEKFHVSDYELKNDRISYSVYTVEHFRNIFRDYGDELFLLIGSDMLMSFDTWFMHKRILEKSSLIVVSRNEGDLDALRKKASELSPEGRIFISSEPPEVVSSTDIRKNFRKNSDFSCYLDENVVQYIRLKGLYSGDN
ncbi:MAG: nicotinate (nicotinamide) nucleotide adenylyltransferase [Ruminococcus flavefaciens]|nr:nicotinate (nicotinamide) nucleotide adenylyltransferase [Ruminococcus flavefaciens]